MARLLIQDPILCLFMYFPPAVFRLYNVLKKKNSCTHIRSGGIFWEMAQRRPLENEAAFRMDIVTFV